jgi:hypothetical protein
MKVKIFSGTTSEMQKAINAFLKTDVKEISQMVIGLDDKGKTIIAISYIENIISIDTEN